MVHSGELKKHDYWQVLTSDDGLSITHVSKNHNSKISNSLNGISLSTEDKTSIYKLKEKKKLIEDLFKEDKANLQDLKKSITNEDYMALYKQYREKLEEIEHLLEKLGYNKENYTEIACIFDGNKFYVEDGMCPNCGDLYTIFFDEIISISYFMIIHSSGVCIFNREFGKSLDPDLTSGLITAIQNFLREISGQNDCRFIEFNQSGFNILTCRGKYSTSALVMSMPASDRIKNRIIQFQESFENNYENELTTFKGNVNVFLKCSDILNQFFPVELLLSHKINYEFLQQEKLSPISQQIIKEIPEINERRIQNIFLDNLAELARKNLRRINYQNLIAAILELREKDILSIKENQPRNHNSD